MTKTIQARELTASDLPKWARDDKKILAYCKENLGFRCNVFSAKGKQARKNLKKQARWWYYGK